MLSWCYSFLSPFKHSVMNKLKTLFISNGKTSEDLRSKRSSSNEKSLSLSPSVDASTYNAIQCPDIQFTSSSDLDDDHSSDESQTLMLHSPQRSNEEETLSDFESSMKFRSGQRLSNSSHKRKSPEQIRQRYNDYHREYLKNYRLRKKNEEAQMKELYQLAINALINVLNANSQIINEEIKANINSTFDYNDQCRKIISLINELYKSSSE